MVLDEKIKGVTALNAPHARVRLVPSRDIEGREARYDSGRNAICVNADLVESRVKDLQTQGAGAANIPAILAEKTIGVIGHEACHAVDGAARKQAMGKAVRLSTKESETLCYGLEARVWAQASSRWPSLAGYHIEGDGFSMELRDAWQRSYSDFEAFLADRVPSWPARPSILAASDRALLEREKGDQKLHCGGKRPLEKRDDECADLRETVKFISNPKRAAKLREYYRQRIQNLKNAWSHPPAPSIPAGSRSARPSLRAADF